MKPIHLLPFLLVALFAVVGKSLPRDSYYVRVKDDVEGPTYAWAIGAEEERRLSELLDHDIRDLDFVGFNMNTVPRVCSHCGKETEIIDWFWTALERGIHSKEWLVQMMREGRLSQKDAHDVYCSRCGHLTVFRDPTGDEGGMPHIAHAPLYDRTTRTFVKREVEPASEVPEELKDAESGAADAAPSETDELPKWRSAWLVKKDSMPDELETDETDELPKWRSAWIVKKDNMPDELKVDEAGTAAQTDELPKWRSAWIVKKDNMPDELKTATDTETDELPKWRSAWIVKKDNMPDELKTATDMETDELPKWRSAWIIKRETAPDELKTATDTETDELPKWRSAWIVKKDNMPDELKVDEADTAAQTDELPKWRSAWIVKKDNMPNELTANATSESQTDELPKWRSAWIVKKDNMPDELKPIPAEADESLGWGLKWLIKRDDAPEESTVKEGAASETPHADSADAEAAGSDGELPKWLSFWLIKKDSAPDEVKARAAEEQD